MHGEEESNGQKGSFSAEIEARCGINTVNRKEKNINSKYENQRKHSTCVSERK